MAGDTASRDENFITSLLAVSSVDGVSTVKLWADPVSHRLLVQGYATTGSGAPNTTPTSVGQLYIDTTNGIVYFSTGTTSSANWTALQNANGSQSGGIVTKTATYTVGSTDYTVLADATSGAITINLPAAASSTGRIFNVKKIDASVNTVTIDASGSETIDGATTKVISSQYSNVQFQCDGTAWYIL